MAYAEKRGKKWRVKYKKPDGTEGSESGFDTKTAAENWGKDQESLIRRGQWIDPRAGDEAFEDFAERVKNSRILAPNTLAKWEGALKNHIYPRWGKWSLTAIFHGHVEISEWVNEMHDDDVAESSIATYFGVFSTILNTAVKAKAISMNPCAGVRVTRGEYEVERYVATPVQVLRAAIRLHDTAGYAGLVLCLADAYTGARWGELTGQRPEEYDEINRSILIRDPLKETGGKLSQGLPEPKKQTARGRRRKRSTTKTPAGTRWVDLPPFLAAVYEDLMASHSHPLVFTTARGAPLRRGTFRKRHWRPAWDGQAAADMPEATVAHLGEPPILEDFTFNEGRHTHRTWLAEDGVPEVARSYRLGHKMMGIKDTYEHVTDVMRQQVRDCLTRRFLESVQELDEEERGYLEGIAPPLKPWIAKAMEEPAAEPAKVISQIPPR